MPENFFRGLPMNLGYQGAFQGVGRGIEPTCQSSTPPAVRRVESPPGRFSHSTLLGVPSRTFYLVLGSACAGEGGADQDVQPVVPPLTSALRRSACL